MCIAFLAVDSHPRYPLVVLANRDEMFARPTLAMAPWEGQPTIIAGRDLRAGGTWFGVNELGHLALLTNYREPPEATRGEPSRGALVSGYLSGEHGDFETYLREHGASYAGFNIIFGHWRRLLHFSNRGAGFTSLGPGIHGLSNALLNTPWPKVVRGKKLLEEALAEDELEVERLFEILDNTVPAKDDELPETGLSRAIEQRLSSIRISAEGPYGSRSATVLLVEQDGRMRLWERPYDGRPTLDFEVPERRR